MKEKLLHIQNKIKDEWTKRSKNQKIIYVGSFIVIIALIAVITFTVSQKKMVPLYNNLSLQEVGQIKTELDTRGVTYELEDAGTTIYVAEDEVDGLLVDLAGQGLPHSGNIDYSFFSENASWGVTDNEFNMIKLDAMQTELAHLMKRIDGIEDAKVMVNMPEESVFVSEKDGEASASIVLHTTPGYEFKGNQIESLYHLVSKAVPNLPPENIAIMNQYFEYFDQSGKMAGGVQDEHTYQQTVKRDVERDIQKRLQQMIGAMVGMDRAIVSVTADIDFTKENRSEELVDPVDLDNMEGLPVSIETIHETYTGSPPAGGAAGTGEEDIPGYQAQTDSDEGEYELVKETINNEFNRIRKDIVESPYKIRDLGIQVAVDSVKNETGNEVQYLSQQDQNTVEDGITSILNSVIGTSIDKEYGEIVPEEKVSIVFQEFAGKTPMSKTATPVIPIWLYIVGGILLAVIIILLIILLRGRRETEEAEEQKSESAFTAISKVPQIEEQPESEDVRRRKQLEKMAKEKPEEFAKLLKGWISED